MKFQILIIADVHRHNNPYKLNLQSRTIKKADELMMMYHKFSACHYNSCLFQSWLISAREFYRNYYKLTIPPCIFTQMSFLIIDLCCRMAISVNPSAHRTTLHK